MQNINDILISVVIPAKNRGNTIDRAIRSVINQKIDCKIEIIIVDDGSEDNTTSKTQYYIERYNNIHLIRNEKSLGGAISRNKGAAIAKGKYIAFLDSDDEWSENHFENKLNLLSKNNAEGCFGAFNVIKDKKSKKIKLPDFEGNSMIDYLFIKKGDTRTSTFVFSKESFLDIMFDDKLAKHQDWDLAIRFSKAYKLIKDSESTVNIYVDVDNRMSNTNNYNASEYFLDKHLPNFSKQAFYNFKLNLCIKEFKFNGVSEKFHLMMKELSDLSRTNEVRHQFKYYVLNNKITQLLMLYLK